MHVWFAVSVAFTSSITLQLWQKNAAVISRMSGVFKAINSKVYLLNFSVEIAGVGYSLSRFT